MAQAYKCDRCGVLFEDETRGAIQDYVARTMRTILRGKTEAALLALKESADLCPECQKSFAIWMSSPEKEKGKCLFSER